MKPNKYQIHLTPDLDRFTFDGEVTITFALQSEACEITLHASELVIVSLDCQTNPIVKYSFDLTTDELKIQFRDNFPVGEHQISIKYIGTINDKMCGFYRSKYQYQNRDHYMAVTQFEAIDARKAFPCVDEPNVKAKFDISLTVPSDLTALSNMPVKSVENHENSKLVTFETTPIMSTYLVAFAIGHFDRISAKTAHGIDLSVYSLKEDIDKLDFALETGTKALDFFTDYFEIDYPLPKLDMIAISDFAAGAMENWGLITYRTACVLCDENTALTRKKYISEVICHEIAHQWFGNLVSPDSWTQLWLNEGFATYFGVLASDHIHPEWRIWNEFLNKYFNRALNLDSLKSTHPVQVEIKHGREVDQIFDAISYDKGSCIIRMMAHYLGKENLRKGLTKYLNRHAYQNSTTDDLWHDLSEVVGCNVKELMDSWTNQSGFPVITVGRESDSVVLEQKRFLKLSDEPDDTLWNVPITIVTDQETKQIVMSDRTMKLEMSPFEWVRINPGRTGFYIVSYDSIDFDLMSLDIADQIAVIADTYQMVASAQIKIRDTYPLIKKAAESDQYVIWSEIINLLNLVVRYLGDTEFCSSLVEKLYHTEGLDTEFRKHILMFMASQLKYEPMITWCLENYQTVTDTNLLTPIYTCVIKHGNAETIDEFIQLYRTSDNLDKQLAVLNSLGATRAEFLPKVYEFMFSEVKPQDYMRVYNFSCHRNAGLVPWGNYKANFPLLSERAGKFSLGHITNAVLSLSELKVSEIKTFLDSVDTSGIDKSIEQSLESIQIRDKLAAFNK
jgi:aminopeptidase N